jgi:hypothetical protein
MTLDAYAECCYAEGRDEPIMLSVVMLSVIMLNVVAPPAEFRNMPGASAVKENCF